MPNQGDLFGQSSRYGTPTKELVRRKAPETSREAAAAVDTSRLEGMVHRAIHEFGPCIADDVRHCFPNLAYSSVTARFSARERKGFISCGPDKLPGKSGRRQRVMRSLRAPKEEA
jgi:hypothetical protein